MALRLMLVSLVASMGFELPSPADLDSWNRSGREWVAARVTELSTLASLHNALGVVEEGSPALADEDEPVTEPTEVAEVAPVVDDLAFDVVVEGMATAFEDDLATTRMETARAEAALAEIAEAARALSEETDRELDRLAHAEELPVVSEVVIVEVATPEPEPATIVPVEFPRPSTETAAVEEGTSRIERLSNAVRLTRRAVEAWASLIDPADSVAAGAEIVLSR